MRTGMIPTILAGAAGVKRIVENEEMRIGLSGAALALFAASSSFAQYKAAPAGAPPEAVPAALSAALDPNGVRITAPDGKVWCEVWTAKSLATGPKSVEEAVSLPTIPHGALIGVVRFPAQATDRRGNTVPAGVYSLRYSIFPADGNHMGAAPQRDFALLIPAAKDKPADLRLNYEQLIALSKETTGAPHPPCLSLFPSSQQNVPTLHQEEKDWVLHVKVGGQGIAVIVVGRAEG
jgi:hypothetical protein